MRLLHPPSAVFYFLGTHLASLEPRAVSVSTPLGWNMSADPTVSNAMPDSVVH